MSTLNDQLTYVNENIAILDQGAYVVVVVPSDILDWESGEIVLERGEAFIQGSHVYTAIMTRLLSLPVTQPYDLVRVIVGGEWLEYLFYRWGRAWAAHEQIMQRIPDLPYRLITVGREKVWVRRATRDNVLDTDVYEFFRADGQRWCRNGKVKTWKTRPDEFRLPVKHGLKTFDYITQSNLTEFYVRT